MDKNIKASMKELKVKSKNKLFGNISLMNKIIEFEPKDSQDLGQLIV
jgi:hypothetical protein